MTQHATPQSRPMTPQATKVFEHALAACKDETGKAEAGAMVEYLCEWIARETAGGFYRVKPEAQR